MNRLQDCFDDDDAGDDVAAGPLFQGMRHDPALDAMHFQHRDCSRTLKAWMQEEPSAPAYVDGPNLYTACGDEARSCEDDEVPRRIWKWGDRSRDREGATGGA